MRLRCGLCGGRCFARLVDGWVNAVNRALMPYEAALAHVVRASLMEFASFTVDVTVSFGSPELHPLGFFWMAASRACKCSGGVVLAMLVGTVAGERVLDVSVPGPAPFDRVMGGDLAPFDLYGVVSCVGVWACAAFVFGEVGEQL